MNRSADSEASTRQQLYRNQAMMAQELRLLTDVIESLTEVGDVGPVMHTLVDGVQSVLPSIPWSTIQLMLFDQTWRRLLVYPADPAGSSGYWLNVQRGAELAAQDYDLELHYSSADAAGQPALMRRAIDQRMDGIAVAPIDAPRMEPLIVEARRAGIPLIAFDTPALKGSAALLYLGTDNWQGGKLAGDLLQSLLRQPGPIGTMLGSLSAVNTAERFSGFAAAFEESGRRLLLPIEDGYNLQQGVQRAGDLLTRTPDLAAVFCAHGLAVSCWRTALAAAGRLGNVALVGFDLGSDGLQMLKDGTLQGLVIQRDLELGYRTVEQLAALALLGIDTSLEQLPTSRMMHIAADLVTLDGTESSLALADYLLRSTLRPHSRLNLRTARRALDRRPRIQLIGMRDAERPAREPIILPLHEETVVGRALVTGQPQLVDPCAPEFDALSDLDRLLRAGRRTVVAVPLIGRDEPLGVLYLESNQPAACGTNELALLSRIAAAGAAAIENNRLLTRFDQRARELEWSNQQQEALLTTINDLSSPIVPIARQILVIPLIGLLDSRRATNFLEKLLDAITTRQAAVVIVDISGVSVIDTRVAHHLVQSADAVRLLGGELVLSGISPTVAQTIVQLGIDLARMVTRADLESAFAYALGRVGGRIVYGGS